MWCSAISRIHLADEMAHTDLTTESTRNPITQARLAWICCMSRQSSDFVTLLETRDSDMLLRAATHRQQAYSGRTLGSHGGPGQSQHVESHG